MEKYLHQEIRIINYLAKIGGRNIKVILFLDRKFDFALIKCEIVCLEYKKMFILYDSVIMRIFKPESRFDF